MYQRTSKPSSRDASMMSAAESDGGVDRREIEDDADLEIAARAAHGLHGQSVAQQTVMRDLHRHCPVLDPGREMSQFVADRRRDPRFIVSRERAHAITEPPRDERGVFRESIGGVPIGPPVVFALQRGRQIPVVESREGFDAALEQSVNQAVVEIDTRAATAPDPVG